MVGVQAGVVGQKFVEHRAEQVEVAGAVVALRVELQFGANTAQRQSLLQPRDLAMGNPDQAVQALLADARGLLIVVARQVVGAEYPAQGADVFQALVVQRHVADQPPQTVFMQWWRVAGRYPPDIAKLDKLGRALAGQTDVALCQPGGQVMVGAGQLYRQGFLLVLGLRSKTQVAVRVVTQ